MSNLQFGKLPQYAVLWAFGDYVAGMNLFDDDTGTPYFIHEVPGDNDPVYYKTLDELIAEIQRITPCSRGALMQNLAFERIDDLMQILSESKEETQYGANVSSISAYHRL